MSFHRTELAFLAFVMLLAVAAAFQGTFLFVQMDGAPQALAGAIAGPLLTLKIVLGLLVGSVLIALFYFFPLLRAHKHERRQFQEMAASLTKKSDSFQQAALTDAMTGLHNRRYFDDALQEYLEAFSTVERPLGIMVLDIDHFKSVNDTYGHDVGDEVLKGLATCIRDFTRHHDISARLGGEEFAVVAPNLTQAELEKLANRLRLAAGDLMFKVGNVRLRVTVSIGIALWDGTETRQALYKRADANLYAAKNAGRNRVCA